MKIIMQLIVLCISVFLLTAISIEFYFLGKPTILQGALIISASAIIILVTMFLTDFIERNL